MEFDKRVAIIGIALRVPDANNMDELWQLIENGSCTSKKIPSSRFLSRDYQGRLCAGRTLQADTGSFLHDPDQFDNELFGISPREAKMMDPQQRILLHIAHEALDDAGYVPSSSPSSDPDHVGVYIGAATNDYAHNVREDIDIHYASGTLPAFLSGRLSFSLSLGGPSATLDTACSSSGVAIHAAVRALQSGDCRMALAGGVNIITCPDVFIGLDAGHFLSRSGQTAPFDSAADGYSRSEGCGIVVLKRLSDAILDNDRILGTIRAIEVNQSYENKSITRTHAPTQAALIRRLLSNAGVLPEQLDVVEAHAAGTRLGDASEVEALRSVFSEAARQDPLYISSVKASIGHLEAASGVASLAKALLMMKHDLIPRQPRIRRLSPPIEALLSSSLVIPANASIIWPPRSDAKPRHALVNNYGAAGSNVSLLLEEHVDPQISNSQPTGTAISTLVFGMSASTERALEELREKYVAWLTTLPSHVSLLDICYSSTARRRKRDYRLSFPFSGDERAGFIRSLQDCRITRVQSGKPEVVFVYPGHGCQYPGMGKILYETCNTFKEEIDRYDILIVREGFPSFKSYLIDGIEVPLEDAAIIEQTALLSYQLALSALWVSWGVSPAAVVGHSLGEYASLVTSGVISSEDALTLIARRAHLVHKHCIPHETGMMAVPLPRDILELELKSEPSFSEVVIACFNNQTRHTVAGPISQLKALKRRLDTIYGDQCRLLPSLYGYHSPAMRPMIEEFKRFTADIALQRPTCSFASTVKGSIFRAGEPLATDHLVQQCIGQVRFFDAVKSLTAALDNVETQICWMEISPRRTTLPLIRRMDLPSHSAMYIDSIDCRIDPWVSISAGLSSLYTTKIELDWRLVFSSLGRPKCVPLPAYPFQTRSFWVPYREPSLAGFSKEDRPEGPSRDQATESTRSSPEYGRQSSSRFEHRSTILLATAHVVRYSRGHVVANIPLAPASIFLECVLSSLLAAHEEAASSPPTYSSVRHLEFVRPLVFQEDSPPTATYLHLDRIDDESSEFTICPWSEKEEGGNIVYARGQCQIRRDAGTLGDVSALEVVKNRIKLLQPAPGRYIDIFTAATIYEVIFPRVVHYAKFFRALDCMVISEDRLEAHAILKLPVSLDKSESSLGTSIHPVYLDAMVHFSGFMVNLRAEDGDLFVCSGIGELDVLPSALATCSDDSRPVFQAYTILSSLTRDAFLADTLVFTSDPPRIVAKLKNIQFKRVRRCVLTSRRDGAHDLPDTPLSSLSRSSSVCPSVAEESASTVSLKQILESALLLPEGCLENHSRIDTLGLDSLTSIEVLHVFRKTYGACVPHDFFEDCSTVGEAEMALDRLIQPRTLGRGSPRDTCLQHLRSTTSARPAVCFIHDGTGMIRPYQSLPDIERDVWAIEDPYMGTTGWDTIEKMASFYAGVLTETPFLHGLILAGYSFGGLVAFEVIKVLKRRGVDVAGLLLLDSPPPSGEVTLSSDAIEYIAQRTTPSTTQAVTLRSQLQKHADMASRYNGQAMHDPTFSAYIRCRDGFSGFHGLHIHDWFSSRDVTESTFDGWKRLLSKDMMHSFDVACHHFDLFNSEKIALTSRAIEDACAWIENRLREVEEK